MKNSPVFPPLTPEEIADWQAWELRVLRARSVENSNVHRVAPVPADGQSEHTRLFGRPALLSANFALEIKPLVLRCSSVSVALARAAELFGSGCESVQILVV